MSTANAAAYVTAWSGRQQRAVDAARDALQHVLANADPVMMSSPIPAGTGAETQDRYALRRNDAYKRVARRESISRSSRSVRLRRLRAPACILSLMARDFAVGVASVGAGYTTLMASDNGAALLDFGAPSGREALRALERMLDHRHRRPSLAWPWWRWWPGHQLTDFVVSHPHADHYSGLLRLASTPPAERPYASLLHPGGTFFYPMVPTNPDAQRVVYFLARLNEVISSLPENALGRAVAATSDGPIRGRPLRRGDEIELAGVQVDVLWPPPVLDERASARLRNLVREYEAIAEEAAERGDERLIRAAAAVRESTDNLRANEDLYAVPETSEQPDLFEIDDDFADEGERQRYSRFDDPEFDARLRRLRTSISRGANLMSLVLATRPQRYIFLGDLDESLHPEVIGDLVDQDHELILSAHHGTHLGPDLLRLHSRYVVSSVGPPSLDRRVRPEYGLIGTHLRTDTAGDVMVWMGDAGTHLAACRC